MVFHRRTTASADKSRRLVRLIASSIIDEVAAGLKLQRAASGTNRHAAASRADLLLAARVYF